jgi:DNA polymerase-1
MTRYTRSHGGHTMVVHAPAAGSAFDAAGFESFTAAQPVLGLDVETSATGERGPRQFADDFTIRLVQFGAESEAWVLDPTDPDQRAAIEGVLADPARRFVTHTNYDAVAIWVGFGIALGQRVIDTHLISKLINPDERAGHGLKELSTRHLDDGLSQAQAALHERMRELAPAGRRAGHTWLSWGWNHIPAADETYVVYAGLDAIYVRRLLPTLVQQCAAFAHLVPMEQWLAAQSTGITIRGLLLDRGYTLAVLAEARAEHARAEATITGKLGCPGASPRFAEWLDTQLAAAGITGPPRTPTGQLQVTGDTLTALLADHADRLPGDVVERVRARLAMAKTSNLIANLRSFLDHADDRGRIHPQINTLRAKTARMSITAPALQTLKKHDPRLRHCLRADPGHVLISCDFSQVEIRVAAALSGDPTLTQVVASGEDIHTAMARLMYGEGATDQQRTISKRCTFGTLYGGGAPALAQQTGVTTDVARQVTRHWRRTYPQAAAYTRQLANQTEVITPSGRRIPADHQRGYANGNYMIQSTARDLLLAAVYRFTTQAHPEAKLWLFVHDEVIIQTPHDDAEHLRRGLQEAMTTTFRGVPIVADAEILGTHWGHLPDQDTHHQTPARSGSTGQVEGVASAGEHGASGEPSSEALSDGSGDDPSCPATAEHDASRGPAHRLAPDAPTGSPARVRNGHKPEGGGHESLAEHDAGDAVDIRDDGVDRPLTTSALAHAARGWRVFPLRPGDKRPAFPDHDAANCARRDPRCRGGHQGWEPRATTDPDRIRRAWTRAPYNIGIACGPSALVVIDLDVPKPGDKPPPEWANVAGIADGADVFAALCEHHRQPLPLDTLQVRTRRGGLHLYFTAPPGVRLGNTKGRRGLGWCIDTRAHGGYVVAAGSHVDLPDGTGTYRIVNDVEPTPLPSWLAQALTPRRSRPAAQVPAPAEMDARLAELGADRISRYAHTALRNEVQTVLDAQPGSRNDNLFHAAIHLGQLVGAGILPDDLVDEALHDAGRAVGLGSHEAAATIRSGLARGAREPRRIA